MTPKSYNKHFGWKDIRRAFWLQAGALGVCMVAAGIFGAGLVRKQVIAQVQGDLIQMVRLIEQMVGDRRPDSPTWCREKIQKQYVRVTLIDLKTGRAFCDSQVDLQILPVLIDRPEVQAALHASDITSTLRMSPTLGDESIYVTLQLPKSTGLVLRVGHPLSRLTAANRQLTWLLSLALGLSFSVSLAVLYWVNRRIVLRDAEALIESRTEKLRGEFVANASHELKTPLASIRGFAELLEMDRLQARPAKAEHTHAIVRGVDRMQKLVHDLLELSVLSSHALTLHPEKIPLQSWLQEWEQEIEPLLRDKQLHVKTLVQTDLLYADPQRIHEVLNNLLSNAIRYSPQGGTIQINWNQIGQYTVLEFSDAGPGIPPAHLARVFERFHRVEAHRGAEAGSGLGLSIVAEIIHLHGGEIGAFAASNGGALFRVQLPLPGASV